VFVSPTVVGEAVIVGSCAGSVYALDRKTGEPRWVYDTRADGGRAQFHGEPLVLSNRIVIPSDGVAKGHVYAFDTSSGRLQWKVLFQGGVGTTPLLVGHRIVVVSATGDVAAIDVKSGAVLWRVTPAGTLKTTPFIPSPTHAANRIFIADNTNQIFALDAGSGATSWRKTLSGRPNTTLVVTGKEVLVGTDDGYLHAIAMKSGNVRKRTKLGGIPYGTPLVSGGDLLVLVSSAKSKFVALDALTHAVRWLQESPKEWTTYRPLLAGPSVIVGNEDKDLCAFDRITGQRRWCRPVGEVPRGLGISKDGVLYVGSLSGAVQAFRMK
jgi:outer membrane protein assembly factor BamB